MDKEIKLPANFDNTHLSVEIYYSLGGMNYFSGNTERRGLYVLARGMNITEGGGYRSREFLMMGAKKDFKIFLKELKRASKKQLEIVSQKFQERFSDEDLIRMWDEHDLQDIFNFVNEL